MLKVFFLLMTMLSSLVIFAQKKKDMPPIIDREIFFGNPEIASGQLSPDGEYISFLKEYNGILNIWVKRFDEPFEEAKPLTDNDRPIGGYFWSYDSQYILFVKDNNGDENYNIYAVDPRGEIKEETGMPIARNLTPLEDVTVTIYMVSQNDPDIMYVGINDRDKAWHDLYKLTISSGDLELLYENNNRVTGWDFDWDEELRLAFRSDDNGFSEIHRVEGDSMVQIYETNLQENAYVAGWNKDNSKFYLVSNKGDDVNFSTLYLMDPQTLDQQKIESDPKEEVDFGGVFFHDQTRELLYTSYIYDKRERHWKNKDWAEMFTYLESQFPGREIGFSSFTKDYNQMLIAVSGDNKATESYYYNWVENELIYQYTSRPALKEVEEHLSEMESIRYKSSDGMEIPAYITYPKGMPRKDLPLVAFIHGGPKGPRDYWGYNPYVQMLANRGYAVLQPNFRASGGFGKEFLNAGDREWGKRMQDDITYGVKHLIAEGVVDSSRVAIMGGSYGGYATLAGLAFTPELYTCGVDIVGPSNLFTLLASIPPYWEAGRKWLYEMVGDPDTEEGQALLRERSPLFSVDNINKPLLIVQGAHDPRVKQAESDQIVIALRDNDKDVEYLLAEDEGHGFRKPNNQKAMWVAIEKFLAAHLGGRYQKEVNDDIAQRLSEITVDINTVELVDEEELSLLDLSERKEQIKLPIETFDYKMLMKTPEQDIAIEVTRSISKEDGHWVIEEMSQSPMIGESKEKIVLDSAFGFVRREIHQGGHEILINREEDEIKLDLMGNEMKIPVEKSFVTGPSLDLLIAQLPLEKGYQVAIQDLDIMKGQTKTVNIEVVDKEGELYKVTATNATDKNDVTTMWINTDKGVSEKTISNKQGVEMIKTLK